MLKSLLVGRTLNAPLLPTSVDKITDQVAPAYHASTIVLAGRFGEVSVGADLTTVACACQFAVLSAGAEHALELCCGSIETTMSV